MQKTKEGGSMDKILTDEQRKDGEFCFRVVDATIAAYGKAVLDCGCESDGSNLAHFLLNGLGVVTCCRCYDTKYSKGLPGEVIEERKEIVSCPTCPKKRQ